MPSGYATGMLLRIRWFAIGVVSSLGAVTYLAAQVKKARQRLSPQNVAKVGASGLAGLLDTVADRISPAD